MDRYHFVRSELQTLRNEALESAKVRGINTGWARAYQRLADAFDSLDAYEAYEENELGTGYKEPESQLKFTDISAKESLKYLANVCIRHNGTIDTTEPNILPELYDDIKKAALILAYFHSRSTVKVIEAPSVPDVVSDHHAAEILSQIIKKDNGEYLINPEYIMTLEKEIADAKA